MPKQMIYIYIYIYICIYNNAINVVSLLPSIAILLLLLLPQLRLLLLALLQPPSPPPPLLLLLLRLLHDYYHYDRDRTYSSSPSVSYSSASALSLLPWPLTIILRIVVLRRLLRPRNTQCMGTLRSPLCRSLIANAPLATRHGGLSIRRRLAPTLTTLSVANCPSASGDTVRWFERF